MENKMKPHIVVVLSSLLCVIGFAHTEGKSDIPFRSVCIDEQSWCSTMADYCDDHLVIVPFCRKTCNQCLDENKKPSTDSSAGSDSDCERLKCEHKCKPISKDKSVCECNEGYELSEDKKSCQDIDECTSGNACYGADLKCINTIGSFQCEKVCSSGQMKYYKRKACCDLTEANCGRNSANGGFAAKGMDAIVTRWPWMSLITVKSTNKECGGILVSDTWVLAAAHCFDNAKPGDVQAYFGIINTGKQTGIKDYSQGRRVNRIVKHPEYRYPSNDVAMIRVTRAVEMTKYVGVTCLPHNEFPPNGQKCWATGYAAIPDRGTVTRSLQQETVEIVERKQCQSSPKKLNVDQNMMCVAHGNRTSPEECQGSTGGPLVCQRCSSCDWYVAGIASTGISCAFDKTFSAFTSVSMYENWIRGTMGIGHLRTRTGTECQIPGKGTSHIIEWREWGPWSACSSSCGNGTSVRRRTCKGGNPGENGCIGKSVENTPCENRACPIWEDWGGWSPCGASCRGGMRHRTRTCLNGRIGRKGCIGNVKQNERCNTQPCPKWSPWQKWGKCSVTCGKGAQTSQRFCINGNVGDKGCVGKNTKSKQCRMAKCPSWSNWGRWSKCSKTCDGGVKVSTRRCILGRKLSRGCEGNTTMTQACNERECQGCSMWSEWSRCSASCGSGTQERHRSCVSKGSGALKVRRPCRNEKCLASWSDWSDWTDCSATCGVGVTTRERKCNGSSPGDCRGASSSKRSCKTLDCWPLWSEWGSWEQCDAKCGKGNRIRTRDCQSEKCPGRPFEEESCSVECREDDACARIRDTADFCELSASWCAIQPSLLWGRCDKTCCLEEYKFAFTAWSSWTTCSKSCGKGRQYRQRRCNAPASCAKFNQVLLETRECSIAECFSRMTTICSASCGGGFRQRSCIGAECDEDNKYILDTCNAQPCEGTLSPWGEWEPCSKTCGLGSTKRERTCSGRPDTCNGELEHIEECKVAECSGTWSEWEQWGLCSVNCGIGVIKRSRTCLDGACAGSNAQEEACVTFDCPVVSATAVCEDDASMQYLCQLLTGNCDNDYMKYACRKSCRLC